MTKTRIPSSTQAKRLARHWADGSPINVMKQAREGCSLYVDPTIAACIKHAWIKPDGSMPYVENGYVWEPHTITPAGLLALECFFQKLRFDASASSPPADRLVSPRTLGCGEPEKTGGGE